MKRKLIKGSLLSLALSFITYSPDTIDKLKQNM